MSTLIHQPSPYIQFYAQRMIEQDMKDRFGEGVLSTAAELLNPFTAWSTVKKYGPSVYTTRFADELKDYKSVRKNISDGYGILVRQAKKLKDTPYPKDAKPKTINAYKNSGWSNLFSKAPTSEAEALVIGAGFYYLLGNAYNKPDMIRRGNKWLQASDRADKKSSPQAAVAALINVGKSINKDAQNTGIVPKWYNIFGQIAYMFNKDTLIPFTKDTLNLMKTKEEIDFSQNLRKERGQDKSPLAALGSIFGVAIGGIVLYFTFPIWFPLLKTAGATVFRVGRTAVGKGAKLAGTGIKKAGKAAAKTTGTAGKSAGRKLLETAKETSSKLMQEAATAAKSFDSNKFSRDVEKIIANMRSTGQQPSVNTLLQAQQIKNMVAQHQGNAVTKAQMKKVLVQLLKEVKEQKCLSDLYMQYAFTFHPFLQP